MTTSCAGLRQTLEERSQAVIEGWYQAVRGSAVALRSPSELHSYLADTWDQVVAYLLLADGQPGDAESIGASFVPLRVRPQAVGRIQQVLLTCLLEDLPDDVRKDIRARVHNLVAGLASGLSRASTQVLLDQQEEIRAAYARSLQRAEEELRVKDAGIESSLNAIVMLDLDGEITYVNPAFLEMWGYEDDGEVIGEHVSRFGEWSGDIERTLRILSEQGGWMGELVAVRRDGTRFDVHASVSPVQDEVAHCTQLMVFFVDITERKRTQRALEQRAIQAAFLNEIGEEIAGQRTTQEVLERAVQLAHETFDFHQVAVLLVDRDRQALYLTAVAGPADDLGRDTWSLSLGEGITGWVAQENETLVANDVSAASRYVRLFPNPVETGSELAVPIRAHGRVIAVLDVQSPVRDAFGESERVVLETLADQIAVALENARLYQVLQDELSQRKRAEEALRRSVQRLETVHEIDQAILGAKSKEEVAEALLHNVRRLIPCQRASIDLFDFEADEVVIIAAVQTLGEGRASAGACFPLTEREMLFEMLGQHRTAYVRDLRDLPQSSPLIKTLCAEGIRSALVGPITAQDQLIGMLSLGSDSVDGFGPKEEPIVEELADTAGIAIQQARLFDSVKRQRERLRRTMARLAEVEETERRRVVRELHDRVGQNLTALDLNLSLMRSHLEGLGVQSLDTRLDDSLSLVAQTNETIRQLMIDLRPPVLDDYGLVSALHWYGDQFSARTGIAVTVKGRDQAVDGLSPHVDNALFRIAQEALNNITKHAQATEVTITLTADEGAIQLAIKDNGRGFAPEDVESERSSWGLLTMRERAESVGAQCLFDSSAGDGTRVLVELPT